MSRSRVRRIMKQKNPSNAIKVIGATTLAISIVLLFGIICFAFLFTWYGKHAPVTALEPDIVQNAMTYFDKNQLHQTLLTQEEQQQASQDYLKLYFTPWSNQVDTKHFDTGDTLLTIIDVENQLIEDYRLNPIWGENMHRRSQFWINTIIDNMDLRLYPNQHRYAITIRNSDIRAFPTHNAAYLDRFKAGEGFPFDTLQTTSVWAGTPLYIAHVSHDGAWALAILPQAFGWIPLNDIAYTDQAFRETWQKSYFITPLQDGISMMDSNHFFHFKSHIGADWDRDVNPCYQ